MPIEPEQGISSETIYEGRIIKFIKEQVLIANGNVRAREIVIHPGAVALVPIDKEDRVIMVRQYRRAAGRVLLEIPAGTREPGEDAETCAQRELAEETGYTAGQVTRLGGFFSAPGFCTEFLDCFLMSSLSEKRGVADDDENIEIAILTREEALHAIRTGEIEDAKSICGLLMWITLANT